MKSLLENDPNSMSQIAQIDEDLFNYSVTPTPSQGRTIDQFIRQLVKNVKNFTAVDQNGNTAFHIAVEHGE